MGSTHLIPVMSEAMSKNPAAKPSSPCTKVCVLDGATGLCEGCGRTRDEIARWGAMSEPERRAIMSGLPDRLARAYPTRTDGRP